MMVREMYRPRHTRYMYRRDNTSDTGLRMMENIACDDDVEWRQRKGEK